MIVRCKDNNANSPLLSESARRILAERVMTFEGMLPLVIGKAYCVFAISACETGVWFYLCDETFTYYPVLHPADLFELIHGEIPKPWIVGVQRSPFSSAQSFQFGHPCWVNEKLFYENLVAGKEVETELFHQILTSTLENTGEIWRTFDK